MRMKTPILFLFVLGVAVTVPSGFAQLPQPIVSPEIMPDHSVVFRLQEPRADQVVLQCDSLGMVPMQKDAQGVWTFTNKPMDPDIYAYSFSVDGLRIADPNNRLLKYNLQHNESLLHIPGSNSLPWEVNNVPHGELHRHFYQSVIAGDFRDFVVYTPPGYNPSAWKKYPALYLLHGYSDDATAWSTVGCANIILDNLIARGQAKPMVVVMPLGYGDMNVVSHDRGALSSRGLMQGSMDKFTATLLKEVIPQVEKAYRVSGDRQNRAIAGVSMGGTEALLAGLNNLDKFTWVGLFSEGELTPNFSAEFPGAGTNANVRLRLLWVSCGDRDSLLTANRDFYNWLCSRGVTARWLEVPGDHSYRLWRRNLADFVPLLFQEKK